MKLKPGTIVILVFDTDKDETDILDYNLHFLKKQSNVKKVIIIPEVKNLEDELVRSCNIANVKELMNDSGNLKITNLDRLIFTKNGEFTI